MLNIVKPTAQLSGNATLFSLALHVYSLKQIGFFSSKDCKTIFNGTCIISWFNSSGNKHLKLIEQMYNMLMTNNKESANLHLKAYRPEIFADAAFLLITKQVNL